MTDEQLVALIAQFRKETEDLIWAAMFQYYFNDGVTYTDVNQVKSIITIDKRAIYMTVNIAGVEYWFLPDLETLVPKWGDMTIEDGSITLAKLYPIDGISVIGRSTSTNGSPEVITIERLRELLGLIDGTTFNQDLTKYVLKELNKSLILDSLIEKIHDKFAPDEAAAIQAIWDFLNALVLTDNNFTDAYRAKLDLLNQDVFTINVPTGDVSERAAGATFGDGIIPYSIETPTGWTCAAAANPNDLLITHNLSRKIAHVDISYFDGAEDVQLIGSLGYTGRSSTLNTVTIKGLSTKAFPLKIELIFSNPIILT